MNIAAEKDAIDKLIYEEKDLPVILAIVKLLENGSAIDDPINETIERELNLLIKEADNGAESSFKEVFAELRKKHAA